MDNQELSKSVKEEENRTLDELIEEAENSEYGWVIVFLHELLKIKEA